LETSLRIKYKTINEAEKQKLPELFENRISIHY